jgi:hypothetical protein
MRIKDNKSRILKKGDEQMIAIDAVAKELRMHPNELLKESLKTYLEKRLLKIETEIYMLAKKYGVKDIFDFDKRIKEGLIHEDESHEDFFILDNLEAEKDKLKKIMENL